VQLAPEGSASAEQPPLAARCALLRRRRFAFCSALARALPLNCFVAWHDHLCVAFSCCAPRLRLLDASDMVMGKKLKQAMLAVRRAAGVRAARRGTASRANGTSRVD
jgi:hypothetical protein